MSWRRSWLEGCLLLMALIFLAVASMGCRRPFRVPEQVRPISGKLDARTTINGLTVEAAAITDEDELMRLFNANMILARILVIKVMLKNQDNEPVDLHRLKFDLRDAQDHEFKFLEPEKAVDKLYEYYEITTYVILTRKGLEADFQQKALSTESDLRPGEERQGLVFFAIPEAVDKFSPLRDLILRLERLRWPQSGRNTTAELRLSR
ncbi:MAG: hypothetical protein HY314_06240 [Acidobacteria bacterium]|nr:hypothetical protein [Acidobacteriota bacterium]